MTYSNKLPTDVCPQCGVRTEEGAYRGDIQGVAFVYCSPKCKTEFDRLPFTDTETESKDFTCISENHSEYMYRSYDQLYRESDKKLEETLKGEKWNRKQKRLITEELTKTKQMYFERMKIYKDLWDQDKKYGSIDRMIKGFK